MRAGKTIVLIDDEEDLCFLLAGMLRAQGFIVHYFHTLKSGLDGLRSVRPDWIIIDNDLPDGRGWQETGAIMEELPRAGIIKISANPDSHRTIDHPNVHYLIKPIHVNSITELIMKNSIST